jgi:hypothetical protein
MEKSKTPAAVTTSAENSHILKAGLEGRIKQVNLSRPFDNERR